MTPRGPTRDGRIVWQGSHPWPGQRSLKLDLMERGQPARSTPDRRLPATSVGRSSSSGPGRWNPQPPPVPLHFSASGSMPLPLVAGHPDRPAGRWPPRRPVGPGACPCVNRRAWDHSSPPLLQAKPIAPRRVGTGVETDGCRSEGGAPTICLPLFPISRFPSHRRRSPPSVHTARLPDRAGRRLLGFPTGARTADGHAHHPPSRSRRLPTLRNAPR